MSLEGVQRLITKGSAGDKRHDQNTFEQIRNAKDACQGTCRPLLPTRLLFEFNPVAIR
jgi:hypothetical protein